MLVHRTEIKIFLLGLFFALALTPTQASASYSGMGGGGLPASPGQGDGGGSDAEGMGTPRELLDQEMEKFYPGLSEFFTGIQDVFARDFYGKLKKGCQCEKISEDMFSEDMAALSTKDFSSEEEVNIFILEKFEETEKRKVGMRGGKKRGMKGMSGKKRWAEKRKERRAKQSSEDSSKGNEILITGDNGASIQVKTYPLNAKNKQLGKLTGEPDERRQAIQQFRDLINSEEAGFTDQNKKSIGEVLDTLEAKLDKSDAESKKRKGMKGNAKKRKGMKGNAKKRKGMRGKGKKGGGMRGMKGMKGRQ